MTTYYINSGGSNTSPYDTWAKAANKISTVAAIWAAGDIAYCATATPEGADTTFTFPNWATSGTQLVRLIGTTDTSNAPPTSIGGGTIDDSGTSGVDYTFNGVGLIVGMTIKNGSGAASINFANSASDMFFLEDCTLQIVGTNTNNRILFGNSGGGAIARMFTKNCSYIWANASQGFNLGCHWDSYDDAFAPSGTIPTLVVAGNVTSGQARFVGGDFSAITSTSLILGQNTSGAADFELYGCKLNAATTTPLSSSGAGPFANEITMYDCSSGDVHYEFAHYSYLGSTTVSTSIYAGAGATDESGQHYSWVVAGTVNASYSTPYRSPWLYALNTDVSTAITPHFECVRDGSTTPFQDDALWSEWSYPGNSGSPLLAFTDDRKGLLAAAADQATSSLGASDWVGENASAFFMKLEPPSFTPAEVGYICGRIVVGNATSVYVDPKIYGITAVSVPAAQSRVTPRGWMMANAAASGGGPVASNMRGGFVN